MSKYKDIDALMHKTDEVVKQNLVVKQKYLTVLEMSKLTGYHKNTLRFYHANGLIPIVNVNKLDSISIKYMEKLKLIRILSKDYGINLAGIKYILSMFNCVDKDLPIEEKIHKYAEACGMQQTYVERRRKTHERKYSEHDTSCNQ